MESTIKMPQVLHNRCIYNSRPQWGCGWIIIGVGQLSNSSTASVTSEPREDCRPSYSQAVKTYLFLLALVLSILALIFFPSFISLFYFFLAVPARHARVFEKTPVHDRVGHIQYIHINNVCLFSRGEIVISLLQLSLSKPNQTNL